MLLLGAYANCPHVGLVSLCCDATAPPNDPPHNLTTCFVVCAHRDLQIIQSLIGALKSPASASGLDASASNGPCGPPSAASPVPGNRTMRGASSRSLPKNRCNSPIATVPLHSL